jgi:hypothetical protein
VRSRGSRNKLHYHGVAIYITLLSSVERNLLISGFASVDFINVSGSIASDSEFKENVLKFTPKQDKHNNVESELPLNEQKEQNCTHVIIL